MKPSPRFLPLVLTVLSACATVDSVRRKIVECHTTCATKVSGLPQGQQLDAMRDCIDVCLGKEPAAKKPVPAVPATALPEPQTVAMIPPRPAPPPVPPLVQLERFDYETDVQHEARRRFLTELPSIKFEGAEASLEHLRAWLLTLVNRYRGYAGLTSLRWAGQLQTAAQKWGRWNADQIKRDPKKQKKAIDPASPHDAVITHTGVYKGDRRSRIVSYPWTRAAAENYSNPLTAFGVQNTFCVAENIAFRVTDEGDGKPTPEIIRLFMEGWLRSHGHNDNLLIPDVKETGFDIVSVAFRSPNPPHQTIYGFVGVQLFGNRMAMCVAMR